MVMTDLDVRTWMATEREPIMVRPYDVFVDLSALDWPAAQIALHVEKLMRYAGFATSGARMTVAVSPHTSGLEALLDASLRWVGGIQGWSCALQQAALERRALLVVLGPVLPTNEIVLPLGEALEQDPMIGTAQPRFADARSDALLPLPGAAFSSSVPREVLPRLPAAVITAEMLSACTLVRATVVESLAFASPAGRVARNVAAAVMEDLVAARRCGFRNLVVNCCSVAVDAASAGAPHPSAMAYPRLTDEASALLCNRFADAATAMRNNAASSAWSLDAAVSGLARDGQGRLRLLLDCRGLSPVHNGTSQCILGLLSGMAKVAPAQFDVHLLSWAEGASFHDLRERFPGFTHWHHLPPMTFAAALVPNQPWSLSTMAELHRRAWALAVNMLDTIAWDILYVADAAVEPAWQFVAAYADGIAFNSSYTQSRFGFRFPVPEGSLQRVVHHSLEGAEHVFPKFVGVPDAGHVLIFGNHYDHKDVAPTIATLSDAFPEQEFVLIGRADIVRFNVRALGSGAASSETVHELMAGATCVVYPSFYEGFGLPLVESLAYGKTVIVRSSPLWAEIASSSRLPGSLVPFETASDLIELLGRLLSGDSLPSVPMGAGLRVGQPAVNWAESAERMLAFVQASVEHASCSTWMRRERVLRMAGL